MNQAEEFESIAFAPPYIDNDGNQYRSMDKLVEACCHYFYSHRGKDGSLRWRKDGRGNTHTWTPKPEDEKI